MAEKIKAHNQTDLVSQLRASEERYQAFIHNSSEGIWRFELDQPIPIKLPPDEQIELIYKYGYLAEANEAMARMYGLKSPEEIIGARLPDLLIRDDPNNIAYLQAFIKSGYSLSEAESHEVDTSGNDKYFLNSLVGHIRDGHILHAWGTQQDITRQRTMMEALRKSEERLAMALKASSMGLWEWDVANDTLMWSKELRELFGLSQDEEITYEKYLLRIHPEDRELTKDIVQTAMKTGEPYFIEHRLLHTNGTTHWVLGRGQAFFENGKVTRMVGTTVNIDDHKRNSELEEINRKLEDQRLQLVELNTSKDEFISLASHQLRTPATGVKQYVGMLLQGYSGKLTPEQMKMLSTAYESNERQLRIIDDLLKVAHIDAGKVTLNPQKLDLVSLIDDVIKEQSEKFKNKNQTITFEHTVRSMQATIDPERMRMVIENLIDNACKYTPDSKNIYVTLTKTPANIQIAVRDEGVGIPKRDIPRLFRKFSRVDNPLSTQVGGTGIGLYWADKIVNLHKGSITVESKLRRGTTFTIIIPRGGI